MITANHSEASITIETQRQQYQQQGFYYHHQPVCDQLTLTAAINAVQQLVEDTYDTEHAPLRKWGSLAKGELIKIDQAHHASQALASLVRNPAMAQATARLTGSGTLQVWATQLFYKPPGHQAKVTVGWHTDKQYWDFWQGEVFTVWLALSESSQRSGALQFIAGSHRWQALNQGDALADNLEQQWQRLNPPADSSKNVCFEPLVPGAFSLHHANIFHGSGANSSAQPRISLAIHLRNERSQLVEEKNHYGLCESLHDFQLSPVIYLA